MPLTCVVSSPHENTQTVTFTQYCVATFSIIALKALSYDMALIRHRSAIAWTSRYNWGSLLAADIKDRWLSDYYTMAGL